MFNHILVPLDGSPLAEAALPAARFFSGVFPRAGISLARYRKSPSPTAHEQPHLHDEKEAAAYLAKIASSFPPETRVDCHVHEKAVSHVARSIADHLTTQLHSDLVIMCIHGEEGARRFVSGSIAQQVIARMARSRARRACADNPTARFYLRKLTLIPIGGQRNHGDILGFAAGFVACCTETSAWCPCPTFDKIPGKWFQVGRLLPGATSKMLDIEAEEMADFLDKQASLLQEKGVSAEVASFAATLPI